MKSRYISAILILLALLFFLWPSYLSAIVFNQCEEVDGCKGCWVDKDVEFFPLACFVGQPCSTISYVEKSNAYMNIVECLCEKRPRNDEKIEEVFRNSHVGQQPYSEGVTVDELCGNIGEFVYHYVEQDLYRP